MRERNLSMRYRNKKSGLIDYFHLSIIPIAGKKNTFLILLLFAGFFKCYGQTIDYIFRHITTNEGLISNKVTALYQDKEGFMWIGTQTGLQRYDGTRFKNYMADIRDTAALHSDWISSIFEDSKNRLWFGSDPEGPYILNRTTGKFYNYNLHAKAENKINGIWHFTEDKNGVVWIAGHDGLYRLNETTNTFENYNTKLGFAKNTIPGWLAIDSANNFWIGTTSGIKFYDQQEKKLYGSSYNPFKNPLFDITESIGFILKRGNDLWITSSRKVYNYSFSTNKIQAYSFDKLLANKFGPGDQKEIIGGLYCLQDGKVIVPLAGRGLAIYQPDINRFLIAEADNTKPYTYHTNESSSSNIYVAQDRSKNTFIGSDKGINIYNPEKQFFKIIKRDVGKAEFFPESVVSDFLQLKDGNILVSYYSINGGIIKTDSALHFKKQFLYVDKGNKNNSSNQIWDLFKDENEIIWAPTQHNSILKLNPATEKITDETDSVLTGPVIIIRQDSGGTIWMGHWRKGLVKLDAATHRKHFYTQFLFSDSANIKRVQCILLDGDKVWTGTVQNGLQLFDKKKEKFTEAYIVNEKNNTSISNNCVTDILRYNSDTLIIATLMGVNIFDVRNKVFKTITVKEGLPNNLVQTVMKDSSGNVWAACYDNGLCKINMQTFLVTRYDVNDGTTDNVFTSKFYQLKNGTVLLGATGSFISFDPSAFAASAPPADVLITGVRVFEKEIMMDALLHDQQPLKLSHTENSLHIEFASIEFWNPGSLEYFYKLEGADKDWVSADKTHTAIYTQLKNGHYLFSVKCANREGVFCTHTTELKIIIKPPFWKTWWFLLSAISAVLLLVYSVLQRRIKNIRAIAKEKLKVQELTTEKYNIQAQLSKARLEALRSQMNPHFIFNSLNAIQECILTNKVDAAYKYLSEFSKLQRMVLNNSQKELIPLSSEIEMLHLYLSLESLRFSKSFVYHIDIAGIADANEIMIPSLITQPLVENAIWHGLRNKDGDKTLEILYEEKNAKIFITIDDNGIGREAAAAIKNQKIGSEQFDSKGTVIVQKRLQVLSQQLKADIQLETTDKKDERGEPGGTKVIISFPSNLETE